jgi:hypothetical protein
LLASDALRRQCGAAGRSLAEAEFDEQRVFGRVIAEYERLLMFRHAARGAA